MRIAIGVMSGLLLCGGPSWAAEALPADTDRASADCRRSGGWLQAMVGVRDEGLSVEAAADKYYEQRRSYGRTGSHIPNQASREEVAQLAQFVYRFPTITPEVFGEVGVYYCEIKPKLASSKSGELLALLTLNGERCLLRLGDPVTVGSGRTAYKKLGNDKVYACLNESAKAVRDELRKAAP